MSDGWDQQDQARDHRGRWRKGRSANPAGRAKGSRNRFRRADPARAGYWKASEWRMHFARAQQTAEGDFEQRRAAAFAECLGLWQAQNPPKARPGLCPQCERPLEVPNSSYDAAPFRIEGVFVHWACVRQFVHERWHLAKNALSRFGIPG